MSYLSKIFAVLAVYLLFLHPGRGAQEYKGGQDYMQNRVNLTDSTALDVQFRILPEERIVIILINSGSESLRLYDSFYLYHDGVPGLWVRACHSDQNNCDSEKWQHTRFHESNATPVWSLPFNTLESGKSVTKEFSLTDTLVRGRINNIKVSQIQIKIRIVLDEQLKTYAEYTSKWMNVKTP